jgi:hypothetical protein
MVTLAKTATPWDRATYLEDDAQRQPQAIGDLMEQLLCRYGASARVQVVVSAEDPAIQSRGSNQVLGSTL